MGKGDEFRLGGSWGKKKASLQKFGKLSADHAYGRGGRESGGTKVLRDYKKEKKNFIS